MERERLLNVPILNVTPYFRNPRKNNKAIPKVAESITKYGYVKVSICVDEDNVLLCGHTTLAALKSLERQTIDEVTRITGLTASQKLGYRIADNKTGEYAEWDPKLLMENYEEMKLLDGDTFDFSPTGYAEKEINRIRDALFPPHAKDDGFKEEKIATTIKYGDVVRLGRHRILCGDSTKNEDVSKLYGKEVASILFTSPPYNTGKEGWLGSSESKYEGDADDKNWRDYAGFLSSFVRLHLDKCCYLFLNFQVLRGNKLAFIEFLHTFMFNIADIIVWDKTASQPAMAENILNSEFELIVVLKEPAPANRKVGTKNFRGTVSNIHHGPPQHQNEFSEVHSATMPMHLAEFIIGNFTCDNETVFEPFLGTGTTLIACEQMNRTCYGMEISPEYCQLTINRWEKLTGGKAECVTL